jgi:hypothetical protein
VGAISDAEGPLIRRGNEGAKQDMDLKPTSPQGPRPADSSALEANRAAETRSTPAAAKPATEAPAKARADSVDVSADAKALANDAETRPVRSSLSASRLDELGQRIANNYYDRADVIDALAKKLIDDPNFRSGGEA